MLKSKAWNTPLQSLMDAAGADSLRFGVFTACMDLIYKSSLCALRYVRQTEDGWNHLVGGLLAGQVRVSVTLCTALGLR